MLQGGIRARRGVRVALVAAVGTSTSPQGAGALAVVLCEGTPGDTRVKSRENLHFQSDTAIN